MVFHRAFEDERKAKMGVLECVKHELMQPFNVIYEREGMSLFFFLLSL